MGNSSSKNGRPNNLDSDPEKGLNSTLESNSATNGPGVGANAGTIMPAKDELSELASPPTGSKKPGTTLLTQPSALPGVSTRNSTKNSNYEGERNEKGEKHGRGKLVYSNGDIYEGVWLNNKKHGRGKYTYKVFIVVCVLIIL